MANQAIAVGGAIVALGVAVWRRVARQPGPSSHGERRLWVVHHNAVPPDMPEASRHWELATLIEKHGWHTTIFSMGFNHKERRYLRPTSLLRPIVRQSEQGVDFAWVYTTPYRENDWKRYVSSASFLITVAAAGLTQRSRPDVVLGVSPHLLSGLAGWLSARLQRAPFVLEVQDLWPESLVQLGLDNPLVIRGLEALERFLYTHADCIVALTEGIARGIVAKGISPDKVVLISNASMRPAPLDAHQREKDRQRLGWTQKVVAIWIGAHGPANGLHVLVEAARELRGDDALHLVLIGDGPEKPRLMEDAAGLPNIEFLDPVPKQDVQDVLRAADIGVIVHRDTGAVKGARPNKLFDYMAAGLPILLNLDGEARRLVDEANAGMYVPAESASELARGLRDLASSVQRREELGRSGFAMVAVAHSREDTADDLAATLDAVTTGQGAAAPG